MFRNSILSGPIVALTTAILAVSAGAQTTNPPTTIPRPPGSLQAPSIPKPPATVAPATGATLQTNPAAPDTATPGQPTPAQPQVGNAIPPAIPGPPNVPTMPTRPSNSAIAGTAPNGEKLIRLDFPNSDVRDVLAFYQELTGVRLIYNAQLMGNVVIPPMQVPKSEAIKIIELSLQVNGVFLEPVDGEQNMMRVSPMSQSPRSLGIPFIDSEEALSVVPAVSEQVVTYMMKLQFADPTEMAQILQTALVSANPANYSTVVPLVKANAILVTDTVPFIRNIIAFVKKADVAPAEVESVFITLIHAQAEDVVANLEKLFEKTQTPTSGIPSAPAIAQQQPGRFQRAPQGGGNPGAAIGGAPTATAESFEGSTTGTGPTEDSIIIGKVKIAADKRTNRIHIVSRPVNMEFIKKLIEEYDADVKLPEPAVRALKYRAVDEVLDSVVAAIRDPGDISAAGAPGGAQGQNGARPGTTTQNGSTTNGGAAGRNTNTASSTAGGSSGDSSTALNEGLTTTERSTVPTYLQAGKSTVIADPFTNTIVVVGTPDIKEKVLTLLDKLDVQQPQVMIEVVIGELKLTKDENYGLDYILKNGAQLNATNNPISGTTTGTGTTTATTTGGIVGFDGSGHPLLNLNGLLNQQNVSRIAALGTGGASGYFTAGNAFTSVVNLLQSTDRFHVITTPRVFTSSNKRAVIASGEEVPVPTNTTAGFGGTSGDSLQTNTSIQYKPIQLRLEVLPLVNSDRDVQLEIVQNVSDRSGNTIIDNNTIPNVTSRAIKTFVTVPNEATLILGGLIKESQDHTRSGIPFLSELPVIGPLFGSTVKNKTRTELIMIMHPVVTMNSHENDKLRERTFEKFSIPPDFDQAITPRPLREKATVPRIVAPAAAAAPAPVVRVDTASTTTTTKKKVTRKPQP